MGEIARGAFAAAGRGRAELITLRILVVGVAVSVVVAAVATFAVADPDGRVAMPNWLAAVTAAAFAVLVIAGGTAPWVGARTLKLAAAGGVGLFFLALMLFAPASGILDGTVSEGTIPWPLTAIGGVVVAAVAVGGQRLGWSAIVVWVSVMAWYRVALGGYSLSGLANDAQALTVSATLCVIAAHALQTSRHLDAAAAWAEVVVADQAAARGRLAARARVAAFVHDEVLAALRGAAEGVPGTAAAVRLQAQRATAVIDAERPAGDWVERVRLLAGTAGADFTVSRSPQAVVPNRLVVEAILIAARQALDNSVRHGGQCARSIRLELGDTGVSLRVIDDGVGFSPEAVTPGRLGIATSIVGAMRDVAGGVARVTSQPGAGTCVDLRWDEPSDPTLGADLVNSLGGELTGELGPDLGHDLGARVGAGTAPHDTPFPRAGAIVVVSLFVATQTFVAIAAATAAATSGDGAWWAPPLVLAGILSAAALILSSSGRTALAVPAVGLLCASVAVALLVTPGALTYGTAWFLPAAGFVLVAVALGARPVLALVGLLVLLLMFASDALFHGGEPVQVVSVVVRTATIVGLGTLLSVSIVRMRRSTRAFAHRAVGTTREREWDAAARRELESHTGELDELAAPVLVRVAAGETLDATDRALARAIEGRLRDGYRAGRLLREPLIDAAMRARIRGVDVVLLDDAGDGDVDAPTAAAIAAWMHMWLDAADERFVGRLLPRDRAYAAHVVVDGRMQNFSV